MGAQFIYFYLNLRLAFTFATLKGYACGGLSLLQRAFILNEFQSLMACYSAPRSDLPLRLAIIAHKIGPFAFRIS